MKLPTSVSALAVAAVVIAAGASVAVGAPTTTAGQATQESKAAASQRVFGNAIDNFYPVVREETAGLPGRTVYRPANMKEVGRDVPVLIWQNGGCRHANVLFMTALSLVAARGFVVIADGAPDAPSNLAVGGGAHPELVTEVMDWLTTPKAKHQFENRLDADNIAVAGQSCGGIEALVAGADPRVDSVLSVNSGFFSTPVLGYGRERLADLHSPVLFLDGGPLDVAHNNSVANYGLVTVPAAHVEQAQGGHALLFYGLRSGPDNRAVGDDGTMVPTEETASVLVNWLDYTLNHNTGARAFFSPGGGLTQLPGWSVQTKNGF